MPGAAAYAEPIGIVVPSGNLSIQGTTQLNGSADLVGFGGFRLRAETLTGTSPVIGWEAFTKMEAKRVEVPA